MKCIVTGAAGFIGSHLAEKLTSLGYEVIGIDSFTDFYSRNIKERNITQLLKLNSFKFIEQNILNINLEDCLKDGDVIFHQAAQAGVRTSWGKNFDTYVENNIKATQFLLEGCKEKGIKKFIFASSSSVYGDIENDTPMREDITIPRPVSPYGVTKLASENLCLLYYKNYKIPVISLRYFTVYGPRQRPDMLFHKTIKAVIENKTIDIYGDGKQSRDFTYISDIIDANILAMNSSVIGEIFNIGGGSQTTILNVLEMIEKISGKSSKIIWHKAQKGDVFHTKADISKAKTLLGYSPKFTLFEGLKNEFLWLSENIDILK